MEEETQHADALLKRIIFLEGVPDMVPTPSPSGSPCLRQQASMLCLL